MIPQEVYKTLELIVGQKNITQEKEILQAYKNKDRAFVNPESELLGTTPDIVIMPKNTEEVQAIVKTANAYKVAYTPCSTFWTPQAGARFEGCLHMDFKRMNTLELDAKNMNATVGSGINYAQLQAEALKHGLYTVAAGGGSQVSVIPNHLSWGFSPLTYRAGLAPRRIMGVEWVLPDGEIVRMGSFASGKDGFWGEGIGPDMRGLLRGHIGWLGSLGIVTRMCVRLLPFHNVKLKPMQMHRHTFFVFPTDRQKWYNFTCPSTDVMVDFMYEIAQAEIGAAMTRVPIAWRFISRSGCKENFWETWLQDPVQKKKDVEELLINRVMLIGYASQKQLEYEEKVIMAIAEKLGCTLRRTRQMDGSWMQSGDSVTMWYLTGCFMSATGQLDSLDASVKAGAEFAQMKLKYTPPLMEDHGDKGWFQINDFGHSGYLEFILHTDAYDKDPELGLKTAEFYHFENPKLVARTGGLNFFNQVMTPLYHDSPQYGPNYGDFARKVKEAFDPDELSNPPGVLDTLDKVIDTIPPLKALKEKYEKM